MNGGRDRRLWLWAWLRRPCDVWRHPRGDDGNQVRCMPASRLLASPRAGDGRMLQDEHDGCDAAQDAEQEDRRKDIDIGQQVAYQHQCGWNRNAVSVGQDKNEGRNEGDDLSQRQPVQQRGKLDDKDLPQLIAESRRLIEGPLFPKLLPHRYDLLLRGRRASAMTGRDKGRERTLRIELGIPIEIIQPAIVQIVRREQPPVAVQLMHRRRERVLPAETSAPAAASDCPCADCTASRPRRRSPRWSGRPCCAG